MRRWVDVSHEKSDPLTQLSCCKPMVAKIDDQLILDDLLSSVEVDGR